VKTHWILLTLSLSLVASVALARPPHGGSHGGSHGGKHGGKHFQKLDADNDGKVTLAEVKSAQKERFTKLDTNKNGVIDPAEHEAKALEHFKRMDKNGDGVVSQDERRGGHGAREHGEHKRRGAGEPKGAAGSGPSAK
jgi:hypothetical protein